MLRRTADEVQRTRGRLRNGCLNPVRQGVTRCLDVPADGFQRSGSNEAQEDANRDRAKLFVVPLPLARLEQVADAADTERNEADDGGCSDDNGRYVLDHAASLEPRYDRTRGAAELADSQSRIDLHDYVAT
jgi:hypothetical protein